MWVSYGGSLGIMGCDVGIATLSLRLLGQAAQPVSESELFEVFPSLEVVGSVVRRDPVENGIGVKPDLLGTLCFANEHLSWRDKTDNQIQLCVVQMECFGIHRAVHFRIREKDFGGATFRNHRQ